MKHMVKTCIRGFGISLLSLCLGFAFLPNDNLIGRLKSTPSKSVGSSQSQISEITSSIYGSFEQEESKEKDTADDFTTDTGFSNRSDIAILATLTSDRLENRSYILQDLYLSLPPPV
jgi:hypothetical protein